MREAALWRPGKEKVHCELCSHHCAIANGERGTCGVRQNQGGILYTLVYDKVAAINLDPIEKKPLYHFLPGTTSLSIGTMGCNLSCSFCQNYSLSMPPKEGRSVRGEAVTPEQIAQSAVQYGAASISYTYSEPTIFFELAEDTAKLGVAAGLKNVFVTNGFMTTKALERLDGVIHAANVDLKSFRDEFYREICQARLAPVLENLKTMKQLGWWLEVTTLLIPGLNDSQAELEGIAGFIATELGPDTPWHVSRFRPTYKLLDRPPTPVESLERALDIGSAAGLNYVYIGNVAGHQGEATQCPECGCVCLDRSGFTVTGMGLQGGACDKCGHNLAGIWS
jgi:pyruvate formate lyase activating enzyme